jgi:MscS family membrane protein
VTAFLNDILTWAGENAWAVQLFAVVLATLVLGAAARRVVLFIKERTAKTANVLDDALFDALVGPTRGLIWVVGLSFAAHIAGEQTDAPIFDAVPVVRSIGVVAAFTWFVLRFIRFYEGYYIAEQQKQGSVDVTFVGAIGKLARAAVSITAVLIALQTVGISITGLLAFGGMGGIAVGLAARDLLANVFGGITIYLDRPFAVGDWIRSPDQEIEGTVEEIGWRRTVIRTFDKRPLYVPNAVFTTISVENPQRMWNRRIKETIGVRYDDLDRVPAILADTRTYLSESPLIDQSRILMVNFNEFGASSLDFFVYCFTRTVVWSEYHAVKEEVLLTIASIISRHGAEIAFPTRTLHVPDGLELAGTVPSGPVEEGMATPQRPVEDQSHRGR